MYRASRPVDVAMLWARSRACVERARTRTRPKRTVGGPLAMLGSVLHVERTCVWKLGGIEMADEKKREALSEHLAQIAPEFGA